MKYIITLLLFLAIPVNASTVDYTHCSNFFKKLVKNSALTNFNLPFSVDEQGKIDWEHPLLDKKDLDENVRQFTFVDGLGSKNIIKVSSENGQVDQLTYLTLNKDPRPDQPEETYSTLQFEILNGKCMPSWNDILQSFPDDEKESMLFDSYLCRDIKKHFDDNPNQASCFDIKSKENKAMLDLFTDAGYDPEEIIKSHYADIPSSNNYGLSVQQRMILSNPQAAPLVNTFNKKERETLHSLLGTTPLLSAHRLLMDCYEKGLSTAINDEAMWNESTVEPEQANQAPSTKESE